MLVYVRIRVAIIEGIWAQICSPVKGAKYHIVSHCHLTCGADVLVDWLIRGLGETGSWDQFEWSVGPRSAQSHC
jgi:hypothetical protein